MHGAYLNVREHPAKLLLDARERQPAVDGEPAALVERLVLQGLRVGRVCAVDRADGSRHVDGRRLRGREVVREAAPHLNGDRAPLPAVRGLCRKAVVPIILDLCAEAAPYVTLRHKAMR